MAAARRVIWRPPDNLSLLAAARSLFWRPQNNSSGGRQIIYLFCGRQITLLAAPNNSSGGRQINILYYIPFVSPTGFRIFLYHYFIIIFQWAEYTRMSERTISTPFTFCAVILIVMQKLYGIVNSLTPCHLYLQKNSIPCHIIKDGTAVILEQKITCHLKVDATDIIYCCPTTVIQKTKSLFYQIDMKAESIRFTGNRNIKNSAMTSIVWMNGNIYHFNN